jgi:hypothetical protein
MQLINNERGAAMAGLLLGLIVMVGIAATVTMLASGSLGSAGFDMTDPAGGAVQARVHQGKAIAEMQAMAKAVTGFFLSTGHYPADLEELLSSGYVEGMTLEDPWGNPWIYRTENRHFILVSYGSDAAQGPKPPAVWDGPETAPDLIIRDGAWLQAPQRDLKLRGAQ